jgi:hypothetical protein
MACLLLISVMLQCTRNTSEWTNAVKHVTRNIPPANAQDLFERPARACLAFATDAGPCALPVMAVLNAQRYFVGLPATTQLLPTALQEVVLLLDDGVYFFDLRALYIRGQAHPVVAPENAPVGQRWFEIVPLKTVAWDYGQLREDDDAARV